MLNFMPGIKAMAADLLERLTKEKGNGHDR
jgi:hypothetical protein